MPHGLETSLYLRLIKSNLYPFLLEIIVEEQHQSLEKLATALSYLDTHKEIWMAVPIVNTYRNHLAEAINSVKEELSDTSEKLDFGSGTLQQLRITIAEKMDVLDDILEAYAEDIADKKLLDEAKNSKSDYLRLTNDGFERKVNEVFHLLKSHQQALADYGMTKEHMDDVEKDFTDYQDKRANPVSATKSIDQNSTQIRLLLEEGDQAFDRLSKVMVSFRSSNQAFYRGFQAIKSDES